MPRNYVGNPSSANFSSPIPIIVDGEDWVDGTINVLVLEPMLDQIAWLKLNSASVVANNTWTGLNTYTNILAVSGGGHLNIDSTGIEQIINGGIFWLRSTGHFQTDPTADMTISCPLVCQGPIVQSGAGALRQERYHAASDADGTFVMGNFDAIYNAVGYSVADRTWTFTAPPGGVSCKVEIFYFVDATGTGGQSHVPSSFGGSSSKTLSIVAGSRHVDISHTDEGTGGGIHVTLFYDGADFWIGPKVVSN